MRRIAGVGAVEYDVNVLPSERTTFCGKSGGRGLGSATLGLRWVLEAQGVMGRWKDAARDEEAEPAALRSPRERGVEGRVKDIARVGGRGGSGEESRDPGGRRSSTRSSCGVGACGCAWFGDVDVVECSAADIFQLARRIARYRCPPWENKPRGWRWRPSTTIVF
jgi:hypothetical protein